MDSAKVDLIAKEVEAALAKIAAKHNVELKRGNIRYSSSDMKFTGLRFVEATDSGLDPKLVSAFNFYSELHGIKQEALDTWFKGDRGEMKIVGYNRRARKNPFMLVDKQGKQYKAPVNFIKNLLPKELLA